MKRLPRTETLLVFGCAAASALLAASQFTNIFELTPPGEEVLGTIDAGDQHGYATLVLAISSLVLLVVAVAARGESLSQGACFGVAVCGVIALLIFLVIDLPDANSIGALDDDSFIDAKAKPAAGFWFELIGSLALTACGAALAALRRVATTEDSNEFNEGRREPSRSPDAGQSAKRAYSERT